jgi:hypothetical protein
MPGPETAAYATNEKRAVKAARFFRLYQPRLIGPQPVVRLEEAGDGLDDLRLRPQIPRAVDFSRNSAHGKLLLKK